MTTGTVTTITTDWRGDTLTAATSSGTTVLSVGSVIDFDEDGGWLVIGDSAPKEYVSVNWDADTVTLAAGAGATYEEGLPVNIWDPTVNGGAQVVEYVATVELSNGSGSPYAVIPHSLIPTSGVDLLIGASVRIDDTDDGEWFIDEVLGREAYVSQAALLFPLLSIDLSANQTIPHATTTVINGWEGAPGTEGEGESTGGTFRKTNALRVMSA